MHEIKCPHCHTAFTVNEASYADILNQVRTQEFQTEIHERLQQAQMQFQSDMQLAQAQAQNQFDKILADKNHENRRPIQPNQRLRKRQQTCRRRD